MAGIKKRELPKFPKYIDIMGTPWKIEIKTLTEYPDFERCGAGGFCIDAEKRLIILDLTSDPACTMETEKWVQTSMKHFLRHEIVHACLYECGLGSDSMSTGKRAWAKNEEMVDWIAFKGQMIYRIWEQAGCLDIMEPEEYLKWKVATKDDGHC